MRVKKKKISTSAPDTQAVEASALNQPGTEDPQAGGQATSVDANVIATEAPAVDDPPVGTATVAPTEAGKADVEAEADAPASDDVQKTIQALKASVEALSSQLQETKERLEAKERAEQQAIRLEKAGIPKALASFIRDDADLESLSDALSGLTGPAAGGVVPTTPTLPTVGSKNPGGEILSIDEMIARAEANNDRAALASLKLAKLSAASNKF